MQRAWRNAPTPIRKTASTSKPAMGFREDEVSKSISDAIFRDPAATKPTILARILAFFSIFHLHLTRFKSALFNRLRHQVWQYEDKEYRDSFANPDARNRLNPVGDLGYSGSTFFTTTNTKFLIKSLPRRFEYTFFMNDMVLLYSEHMTAHPESLLARITDFLYNPYTSIGGLFALTPSHHVVMENALYGKMGDSLSDKWETYDLKPQDFFYPERDLAGGALASESVKDRLLDKFPDKVRITKAQKDDLVATLEKDTDLLASCNAVDYSLFLIRFPAPTSPFADRDMEVQARDIPTLQFRSSPWRTGVVSADGKWMYRLTVLDFFWAKHKTRAKLMTALVKTFNKFAHKGPMSITADPLEYKKRFLSMVENTIEVVASA